ncbi:tether containing UBX domain for GLUT4-like [Artemia franciscana]|uniref:UBX domain-containing protein n=1 Tax=Artemia franciscana TaxID=6661 RepID=A0AA88LE98_ARTSF|nr:hypothetical protein QYM36_001825 [Artemia franciscana]KAK2723300.1 hypothetical protein QYM36_001825 [Artemia franciscana]
MSSVTVLCPNGRRVNVKVGPNTVIAQIIEQACVKYSYEPCQFDLKHIKRVLKPDSTVRFEQIPNNAQLELVPVERKRRETSVQVFVQLPSGERMSSEHNPDVTLWDLLEVLKAENPDKTDFFEVSDEKDLSLIYVQTEVKQSEMKKTTLRSLGLIGGRGLIRMVHKPKNVSLSCLGGGILQKPKKEVSQLESRQLDTHSTPTLVVPNPVEIKEETLEAVKQEEENLGEAEPMDIELVSKKIEGEEELEEEDAAPLPMVIQSSGMDLPEPEPPKLENFSIEEEGQVYPLGERDALLFDKNQVKSARELEVDDDFFEHTLEDIKLLHKDLVMKRKEIEQETENLQTLMSRTKKEEILLAQREADKLAKLHRYPKTTLRINFPYPDNYVLQAVFRSSETIAAVMEFTQKFINTEKRNFFLYTSPPKKVLEPEARLFELDLAPASQIYVAPKEEKKELRDVFWLNEETRGKLSSYRAAERLLEAARSSYRADRPINLGEREVSHVDMSYAPTSNLGERARAHSRQVASEKTTDVPKWFKLGR